MAGHCLSWSPAETDVWTWWTALISWAPVYTSPGVQGLARGPWGFLLNWGHLSHPEPAVMTQAVSHVPATIKSFQTINFYCRITTLDQYEFWWNVYHIQIQKAFLQYIKSINWIKCSTENILSKSSPPDDQYWIFYDDICLEIPPPPSPPAIWRAGNYS